MDQKLKLGTDKTNRGMKKCSISAFKRQLNLFESTIAFALQNQREVDL